MSTTETLHPLHPARFTWEEHISRTKAQKGYELAVSVWCYVCIRWVHGQMSREAFDAVDRARNHALMEGGVVVDVDVNDTLNARHVHIYRLESKAGAQ